MASFNVNGMRNDNKRREIFNYLKHFNSHIILLQETHSVLEDERVWNNEWGNKIIFNHGTSNARGVAVLIDRNCPVRVETFRTDLEGRYLIIDMKLDSFKFVLVNVYGPNEDNPQFFIKLFENIENRNNNSMIMAGDFNTSLDPEMDLYNNKGSLHTKKREILKQYLEEKDLTDIWRIKHPEARTFTWKKPNVNDLVMSRIDHIFISQDFAAKVNSAEIKPKYKSDHSRLTLSLDLSVHKRGRGVWKFNNLHLKDKEFLELMNATIVTFLYNVKNKQESPLDVQWESLKATMIRVSKDFAGRKAKEKSLLIEKLEQRILTLDQKIINSNSKEDISKYMSAIKKTEEFLIGEHEKKVEAAKFRTKNQYYQQGEKNSSYFFNLEKSRGSSKIISALNINKQIIRDPKRILQEEKLFYQKLYSKQTPGHWQYKNSSAHTIKKEDHDKLEEELNDIELSNSLAGMPNNKTPGSDGLTTDFYKTFWIHLKLFYGEVVRFLLKRERLHKSATRGIISLLPKKDKDLLELSNWRPLTLLNVDYKIISRALALRLKPITQYLISEDQTGFIAGRNISHGLRSILDIIQVAKQDKLEAVIVSLDWQKAFDRVSRVALDNTLEFFNFGPNFRAAIQTLFRDSQSCVANNGHFSEYFPSDMGIKQGCNISPTLWTIQSELLSLMVRENKNIKGIKLGDTQRKLSQFADDNTFFLQFDRVTLLELENTLEAFEEATCLRINYNKTCIYRVGSLANSEAKLYTRKPFLWTNSSIKVLGITIDHVHNNVIEGNFLDILDKVSSTCKLWKDRGLTLMGKVLIVNALCSSLYVYKLMVLGLLPQEYLQKYNSIVSNFLWDGGRPKISFNKLCNDKEYGGLKLVNLRNKDLALKCQWVATARQFTNIRTLSEQFLPEIGQDFWLCNFKCTDVDKIVKNSFWRDVAYAWSYTHWHTLDWDNVSLIAAQTLWFNSHIKVDRKLIFYPTAFKAGILSIINLWNIHAKRFFEFQEMQDIYGANSITFLQYYGIISAVPKEWIRGLTRARVILDDYLYPYENFEGKMTQIVYGKLTYDKKTLNKLLITWNIKLGSNLVLEQLLEAFQSLYLLVPDTKMRNFQFRYLHRIIFTGKTLYRWKLSNSPLCEYCKTEYETLEHLFFECNTIKRFWETFVSWFEAMTDTEITLDLETISFCNHENSLVNTLIILAKQHIFARRILERPPNIYILKEKIFAIIKMERDQAFRTGRFKPFVKKWKQLFPNVD